MTALILLGIVIILLLVTSPEFKSFIFRKRNIKNQETESGSFSFTGNTKKLFKNEDNPKSLDSNLTNVMPKVPIDAESSHENSLLGQSSINVPEVADDLVATKITENDCTNELKRGDLNSNLNMVFPNCSSENEEIDQITNAQNLNGSAKNSMAVLNDRSCSTNPSDNEAFNLRNHENISDTIKVLGSHEQNVKRNDQEEEDDDDDLYEVKEVRSIFGVVYKTKVLKNPPTTKVSASSFEVKEPTKKKEDPSIIDVSDEGCNIEEPKPAVAGKEDAVPFWNRGSISPEANKLMLSNEQQLFYVKFKNAFLSGEYLDVDGNFNYAFKLLSELVDDFGKSSATIKMQLSLLAMHYPITKNACDRAIKDLEEGDVHLIIKTIENVPQNNPLNLINNNNEYLLGCRFKDQLKLNKEDVQFLNNIGSYSNTFTEIEFCVIQVIKLFLELMRGLKSFYAIDGRTIDSQVKMVTDIVASKHYKYVKGSDNYMFALGWISEHIYSYMFKNCENYIREYYGVKRKLKCRPDYAPTEVTDSYINLIEKPVLKVLDSLQKDVVAPDDETELLLNEQNVTRWKIKFNEYCTEFKDSVSFTQNIDKLGSLNIKNPSIENIYYEASKFISKYDKLAALKYYLTYIYYDLISVTFNNKQLTKTVQKCLFTTNEQLDKFKRIMEDLVKYKDLKAALASCENFYEKKRRKIKLDKDLINEVVREDSSATELLNNYLQDDEDPLTNTTVLTKDGGNDELIMTVEIQKKNDAEPLYKSSLNLNIIQTKVLDLFRKDNLEVPVLEIEALAKSCGYFAGQLIESINESCFELFDDNLIEQKEDLYLIDSEYFKFILTC